MNGTVGLDTSDRHTHIHTYKHTLTHTKTHDTNTHTHTHTQRNTQAEHELGIERNKCLMYFNQQEFP